MNRGTLICVLLLLLFAVVPVYGISIRPGTVKMNLVPGFERTFDFWVGNTMDEPIGVDVQTYALTGGFEHALTPSIKHVELGPREMKKFEVTLKIPEDIVAPGVNLLQVAVYEERKQNSIGGINLRAAVASTFEIRGLYPGKYAEAFLDIQGDVTKQVDFIVEIYNFGTDIISKATARFEVYNVLDNSFVTQVDGTEIVQNLESWKSGKIKASLGTHDIKEGQYKVIATVFYDANTTKADGFFRIGEYNLQILDFPDSGKSGQIMDFPVKLKSEWNQEFKDVKVVATIKKKSETVASMQADSTTLAPFESRSVSGFLDLRNVAPGEHEAEIRVYFEGGVVVQSGPFNVYDEYGNLYPQHEERKGGMIAQRPTKPFWTTTNLLIIVIAFLVLLNVLWFFKYLKNKEAY